MTVQDDWLWMDELDHVNVITFLRESQEFVFFKQRKYVQDKPLRYAMLRIRGRGRAVEDALLRTRC